MATAPTRRQEQHNSQPHRRTSIGNSVNTRQTNKRKKTTRKPYRGQGR